MSTDTHLLAQDIDWLGAVIDAAIRSHFDVDKGFALSDHPPPEARGDASDYGRIIAEAGLGPPERLILILALAPDLKPQCLDPFLIRNPDTDRPYSAFGGTFDDPGSFVPTVQTALFLLSDGDLGQRLTDLRAFQPEAPLLRSGLLRPPDPAGPRGRLAPTPALASAILTGQARPPSVGPQRLAPLATTQLGWDDLVLPPRTAQALAELLAWLDHGKDLLAEPQIARILNPGYRCLFTGPTGTGKTLTATLLGQRTGREVYRLDLSKIVAKYIGETEKNLNAVFDLAEGRNCIVLFDEADALFGKRTGLRDAHDRFAHQEVAHILDRIAQFSGVAIMAGNLTGMIDSAFARRFDSVVPFVEPGTAERRQLWARVFQGTDLLDDSIDLDGIARDHEINGGAIVKVLRHALLASRSRGSLQVSPGDLHDAITREMARTGKP